MKLRLIPPVILLVLSVCLSAAAIEVRDVPFATKNAGRVVFSHKQHIKQKGMSGNCKACHDGIFSIKKRTTATMSDMAKGKSCGACHNGGQAFALKECARCHQTKEISYTVKATGPTRFSHKRHLVSTPDCAACHPGLFAAGRNKHVSMAEMKKGRSCGACHDGKRAFTVDDCTACHPVKDISFKVAQTGPTKFSHTTHIKQHGCSDCHTGLYRVSISNRHITMGAMEKGASCGACHNGKAAFALENCMKCHPTKELTFAVKDIGNALFSHSFHGGLYKCGDCHTALFSTSRSKVPVTMGAMEKGKSCGGCHDGKSAFSVKEKCDTCHKT